MAEKIILEADIDVQGAAKSLSTLKQEFKELQLQLDGLDPKSKQYAMTLKKMAATKDDIGDLRQEMEALNPDKKLAAFGQVTGILTGGFQAATGAAALFGAETKDVEKAMLKLQAAQNLAQGIQQIGQMGNAFKILNTIMRANPIGLIVTAVVALGVAFFAFKDKIKVVGEVFDWLGAKVSAIINFFKDLLDTIGLTNFKAEEMAEKLSESAKEIDKAMDLRGKAFDREKKLAEAAGKSVEDIEIRKQANILKTLKLQESILEKQKQLTGKLTDEQKTKLDEVRQQILDTRTELEAIELKSEADRKKKEEDAAKKRNDEYKKRQDEEKKRQYDILQSRFEIAESIRKKEDEERELEKQRQKQILDDMAQQSIEASDAEIKRYEDAAEERIRLKEAEKNLTATIDRNAFAIAASIGELFINNAEKQKKYQKAVALAKIGVDTAKGISSAIAGAQQAAAAGGAAYPFLAAAYTIEGIGLVLANMAQAKKILADSDSGGSAPPKLNTSAGGGGNFNIPQVNGVQNTNTILSNIQQPKPVVVKAVVTETDITKSQKQVQKIEDNSTL